MIDERNLTETIARRAYQRGMFTLASGKTSDYYLDLKAITLEPDTLHACACAAWRRLQLEDLLHPSVVVAVAGVAVGGIPLATALALYARERRVHWSTLIVRPQAKDHGTGHQVEGAEWVRGHYVGSDDFRPPVILFEDVITTGGSALRAASALRIADFRPTVVIGVVDREEGGRAAIEAAGMLLVTLATVGEMQRYVQP